MNHQMNSKAFRLEGYNLWFTVEIITHFSYQLTAIYYIFESALLSNFGYLDKVPIADRYQYDFIHYHQQELNWMSFVMIRLSVNGWICYFNFTRDIRYETDPGKPLHEPLKHSMWMLCVIHIIEFFTIRNFL